MFTTLKGRRMNDKAYIKQLEREKDIQRRLINLYADKIKTIYRELTEITEEAVKEIKKL